MDKYSHAKKLTDEKLQSIRQRSEQLMQRQSELLNRQQNLAQKNGGTNIRGSDKIHLNVGGTELYALRETLTKIKGSRLEALFSGRWEDKLLRDEKGRVFLDLDVRCFKKIMEYLHLMKTNEKEVSNWPKLTNKTQQKILNLYIDFLCLRQGTDKQNNSHNPSIVQQSNKRNNGGTVSCQDLLENEAQLLDEAKKNLDKMEKDLAEEEECVSFFTTSHPQANEEVNKIGFNVDTDDVYPLLVTNM